MKIDINRLAKLAGLEQNTGSVLRESKYEGAHHGMHEKQHEDMSEMEMEEDDMDEMIEVDETVLVQELRRARKMLSESKRRNRKPSRQALQEAELKKIIESEVSNVMQELNLNSSWIYGNNRPQRSKKGYSHQGSFLKGLGFK